MCSWNGNQRILAHSKRIDAGYPVNFRAIAAAGINMGDPAFTAVFLWIEIGVQYASAASKLQFSSRWFGDIRLGIAE